MLHPVCNSSPCLVSDQTSTWHQGTCRPTRNCAISATKLGKDGGVGGFARTEPTGHNASSCASRKDQKARYYPVRLDAVRHCKTSARSSTVVSLKLGPHATTGDASYRQTGAKLSSLGT
eukprot:4539004-Amphidinium_carterae.1